MVCIKLIRLLWHVDHMYVKMVKGEMMMMEVIPMIQMVMERVVVMVE